MKRAIFISILSLAFAFSAHAQQGECPAGRVCISPEAARQALQDSDVRKALEAEVKVKDDAIDALKKELATIRLELAKAVGEKTGAEQMNVRLTAIVDVLLKHVKPKKIGIINF
jgi:Skp family chaperone for outer membrane proteins